jgi:hypothetical protein
MNVTRTSTGTSCTEAEPSVGEVAGATYGTATWGGLLYDGRGGVREDTGLYGIGGLRAIFRTGAWASPSALPWLVGDGSIDPVGS